MYLWCRHTTHTTHTLVRRRHATVRRKSARGRLIERGERRRGKAGGGGAAGGGVGGDVPPHVGALHARLEGVIDFQIVGICSQPRQLSDIVAAAAVVGEREREAKLLPRPSPLTLRLCQVGRRRYRLVQQHWLPQLWPDVRACIAALFDAGGDGEQENDGERRGERTRRAPRPLGWPPEVGEAQVQRCEPRRPPLFRQLQCLHIQRGGTVLGRDRLRPLPPVVAGLRDPRRHFHQDFSGVLLLR